MKLCSRCNTYKEETEFNIRYNDRQPYCAECSRNISKQHYQNNVEDYKERARVRKLELRIWMREIRKELKCSRCGENHPATLDFHHTDGSIKEGSIANLVGQRAFSKKRILEEIAKCEVLCSNCHRKEHYTEF